MEQQKFKERSIVFTASPMLDFFNDGELQFKPEITDFKVPEWKEIDVWENRDLDLQIESPPKNETETAPIGIH